MASRQSTEEAIAKLVVDVHGLDIKENELGRGAYGVVLGVTVNGKECIAKKLHLSLPRESSPGVESYQFRKFREECVTLSGLRHPNLVEFIGIHYGADRNDISLIMERLHIDLADFAEKNPNTSTTIHVHIFQDIANGLVYLHSLDPPLIHRDLTAPNILLTKDLKAKIGDLGVSRYIDPKSIAKLTNVPGNHNYMPPEAKQEEPTYTTKLDVFSFGNIIIHTLTGKVPSLFDLPLDAATVELAKQGKCELKKRKKSVEEIPQGHCLYGLMVECLHDNPDHRPTAQQLRDTLSQLQQQQQQPLNKVG